MTTTYTTIAEEKNALLESIITKKIKSIQIAVQHAKSINRRDAARPLTLAINCANVTLKLLIENKRQKMELKKVKESIDTLQSQSEESLNRARQNHEVELYALRKDVEKVESENVALLQKIKSFKNLHEVHENARLTNKLNRLNAERVDRLHSHNNNTLPNISNADHFDQTKRIQMLEDELKKEKAARMRAENAVYNLTTSSDARLHIMYTDTNDIVDKMYKLEQNRSNATTIAHNLRKQLKAQVETSTKLKRLCERCMSQRESLENQLNLAKNEILKLQEAQIELKAGFKNELVKEQMRSEISKARYLGKSKAEEAFRKTVLKADGEDMLQSFNHTKFGHAYRIGQQTISVFDET